MQKEIIQLELTSLSHDGRAVGRVDARVVFVEHALPGQVVRATITKSKKNFAEATCLEVVQEAPNSIAAPCPHASECGGCPLQTMPAAVQLQWKESMVREAMTRIAKLDAEALSCIQPIIPSPQAWGYRNKMEFAFGHDAQGVLVLGMRAKGSHAVVAVPHCKLMPEGCMEVIRQLSTLCQEAKLKAWDGAKEKQRGGYGQNQGVLRHVVLRRPHSLGEDGKAQLLVNIITAPADKNTRLALSRLGKDLMQACSGVTGFVLEERRSAAMVAQGEHVISKLGQIHLQEHLGGVTYTLGHNAFFQINTEAAEALCTEIVAMSEAKDAQVPSESCFWDLYCGVGAPGLSLARSATALYGVEINPKAIEMAKRNAKSLGYGAATYTAGDAKKVMSAWPKPRVILLDPPRTGMAPEVVETILNSGAERLLYVSCNPATLARDVALLSTKYTLQRLVPLDFFPQTPHVESCALLVYKD